MATKTIKKKSKKVNLEAMEQIDGALSPQQSVEDMLGDKSGYTTTDVKDYIEQINAMSDADLHDHSVKIGVTPIAFRDRLIDRLERQFLEKGSKKYFQPSIVQFSQEAMSRQQRLMRGNY